MGDPNSYNSQSLDVAGVLVGEPGTVEFPVCLDANDQGIGFVLRLLRPFGGSNFQDLALGRNVLPSPRDFLFDGQRFGQGDVGSSTPFMGCHFRSSPIFFFAAIDTNAKERRKNTERTTKTNSRMDVLLLIVIAVSSYYLFL